VITAKKHLWQPRSTAGEVQAMTESSIVTRFDKSAAPLRDIAGNLTHASAANVGGILPPDASGPERPTGTVFREVRGGNDEARGLRKSRH